MPKSLISYVNGRYIYNQYAMVHIEDRGYQFSDGVYEVISYVNGQWVDLDWHLDRLEYSLRELKIDMPMSRKVLEIVINNLMGKNNIRKSAYVYLQITRGVAPRNHVFPIVSKPSVVMTVKRFNPPALNDAFKGIKVITGAEIRWARPDIKSVSLLPNILAKQEAKEQGADEYWFIKNGGITEGGSSNSWIITKNGELITHASNGEILKGITRTRIIKIANELGLNFVERTFTLDEAYNAAEAFVSSSTALIRPVVQIDDKKIGKGEAGPITKSLITNFYAEFGL